MQKYFQNKNSKGFTLIELLVVVAIIGLLSSVVLASLNSARAKARDAKKISEFNQVSKGLQLYYDKFGQYPNNNTTPPSGVPVGTNTQIVQFMNMAQLFSH